MPRRHSDVLIAVLIMVGTVMWFANLTHRFLDATDLQRLGILVVAGFVAAQVARRALIELELGATVVAAVIAMAVVIGMFAQQRYQAMDIEMLLPVGATAGGGLLGAWTSRHRAMVVSPAFGVIAGGFAGFGAMLSVVGATALVSSDGSVALPMLLGDVLGAFLFVLWTTVPAAHCAFGVAVVSATMAVNATDAREMIVGALGAFVIGWILGAIGGGIGGRIRDRRRPRPDLPAAQVR